MVTPPPPPPQQHPFQPAWPTAWGAFPLRVLCCWPALAAVQCGIPFLQLQATPGRPRLTGTFMSDQHMCREVRVGSGGKGGGVGLSPLWRWSQPCLGSELLRAMQHPDMWRWPWPGKEGAGGQWAAGKGRLVAQQGCSRCSYVLFLLFLLLFFSWSFVNKHASKGLAGCWNWPVLVLVCQANFCIF